MSQTSWFIAERDVPVEVYSTLSEACERMLVVIVPPGLDDTYGANGLPTQRVGFNAVAQLDHFDPTKDKVGIFTSQNPPDPLKDRTGVPKNKIHLLFDTHGKEVEAATSCVSSLLTGNPTQQKSDVVMCTATGHGQDVSESGGDYKADLNPTPVFQKDCNALFCVTVEDSAQHAK